MPDKNPDAGPIDTGRPTDLLRHTTPPGLKRWGRMAVIAAVVDRRRWASAGGCGRATTPRPGPTSRRCRRCR